MFKNKIQKSKNQEKNNNQRRELYARLFLNVDILYDRFNSLLCNHLKWLAISKDDDLLQLDKTSFCQYFIIYLASKDYICYYDKSNKIFYIPEKSEPPSILTKFVKKIHFIPNCDKKINKVKNFQEKNNRFLNKKLKKIGISQIKKKYKQDISKIWVSFGSRMLRSLMFGADFFNFFAECFANVHHYRSYVAESYLIDNLEKARSCEKSKSYCYIRAFPSLGNYGYFVNMNNIKYLGFNKKNFPTGVICCLSLTEKEREKINKNPYIATTQYKKNINYLLIKTADNKWVKMLSPFVSNGFQKMLILGKISDIKTKNIWTRLPKDVIRLIASFLYHYYPITLKQSFLINTVLDKYSILKRYVKNPDVYKIAFWSDQKKVFSYKFGKNNVVVEKIRLKEKDEEKCWKLSTANSREIILKENPKEFANYFITEQGRFKSRGIFTLFKRNKQAKFSEDGGLVNPIFQKKLFMAIKYKVKKCKNLRGSKFFLDKILQDEKNYLRQLLAHTKEDKRTDGKITDKYLQNLKKLRKELDQTTGISKKFK
ncbi:MAG: hypothetical protein PVI75_07335 [Gammaproteobacteria bacterium]|jgi:hypothetical protein